MYNLVYDTSPALKPATFSLDILFLLDNVFTTAIRMPLKQ
jgi:hypothetical protein